MSLTTSPQTTSDPVDSVSSTVTPSISSLILDIKADLRASMNGLASRTIRESGMGYKLVFGVELPRLRQIAAEYQTERALSTETRCHLALSLWQENIRECKLLAVLIYSVDEFDRDVADFWISDLQNEQAEVAQLLSMEQLCKMPQAADFSFLLMADERPIFQLCGFLTLTRLLMRGAQLSPDSETEFLDQAAATLPTPFLPLKKAVQNALLRYAESSDEAQNKAYQIFQIL